MDKTVKKIRNIGKIFTVILIIVMIISIIFTVFCGAAGLALVAVPDNALPAIFGDDPGDMVTIMQDINSENDETDADALPHPTNETEAEEYLKHSLIEIINNVGNGSVINGLKIGLNTTGNSVTQLKVKHLLIILLFMMMLFALFFTIYCSVLKSIMKTLSNGERPFTIKAAKKLRRISILMILLVIFEPTVSLILFAVTLIFSYLFEYGAYLQDKADETLRIQEEMIMSFAEVTENKSEQTGKHVRRVAEYTKIIAEEMGLPENKIENIKLASTMHDIGKLLIPAEILEKPARLTDEEFAAIKKHPGYGGMLLENVEGDVMKLARTIALDHHERVDGRGYPKGKNSEEISIEGRIVAVADVYDALTSKRSYKEPWDHEKAYEEIIKGSGTQFDRTVVDAFKRSYSKINEMRQLYADETLPRTA